MKKIWIGIVLLAFLALFIPAVFTSNYEGLAIIIISAVKQIFIVTIFSTLAYYLTNRSKTGVQDRKLALIIWKYAAPIFTICLYASFISRINDLFTWVFINSYLSIYFYIGISITSLICDGYVKRGIFKEGIIGLIQIWAFSFILSKFPILANFFGYFGRLMINHFTRPPVKPEPLTFDGFIYGLIIPSIVLGPMFICKIISGGKLKDYEYVPAIGIALFGIFFIPLVFIEALIFGTTHYFDKYKFFLFIPPGIWAIIAILGSIDDKK